MMTLRLSLFVSRRFVLEPFKRDVRLFSTASVLRNSGASSSTENLKAYVQVPFSYAYGRSMRTLKHLTVSDILENQTKENGSKMALVSYHEGLSATFSELDQQVNQVSRVLLNLGVKRGDVVSIWSCNSFAWVTAHYACARVGAILCTLNPYYKEAELAFGLQKARVKVLFMPGKNSNQKSINNFHDIIASESLLSLLKKDGHLEHVIYMDDEGPSRIGHFQGHSLHALQKNESTEAVRCEVDPSDAAIIMFTSGTTGKPKGAALSHFTCVNNPLLVGGKVGLSDRTVICCPLPLFHSFACILGSVAMSAIGGTLVLTGYQFDTKSIVDSAVKYGCTLTIMTPTMIIDVLNHVESNNVQMPSLRSILAGGASVPVEVAHRASKVIPSVDDFRIGYGATELGPCVSASNIDYSPEKKLETVGSPLDFVEIKLVNPNTGQIVKLGEQGELLARGHNVMLGYWDDEEKTKEAITEANWYKTGDMATMDEDGCVKIVGRTKELIIRGGENIYPKEIEEFLHEHPDILDNYVVGVPDERMGEECCAWVKLRNPSVKLTEEDVKKFLKDKITYFKVPKYVLFVDSFPLTSTGKAQKFIMREDSCKILGLKENK